MDMTLNNANVFISSMLRTDKRFKYYGEGPIANINLLKMIYKYACYSTDYADLQRLDAMVSILQQSDPDICMNILGGSFFPEDSPEITVPDTLSNTAPTVLGNTVILSGTTYTFVASEFLTSFDDADGDASSNIIIKTLPDVVGGLALNGVPVIIDQTISQSDIPNLVYTRDVNTAYGDLFTYAVYDNNQNPLPSNTVSMTVTVLSNTENASAVIGDNTIYPENRVETILTLAMFTTDTTAPYSDAEGDLLDAIRIVEISLENSGTFYINGVQMVVGDIITREQMNAGDFKHVGPDQNSISSDVFEFEGRDEGSLEWVS